MIQRWRALLGVKRMKAKKSRFFIIGLWNTFFSIVLFYLLLRSFPFWNYQFLLLYSFVVSTIQSHFMQRFFVWQSKDRYISELLRFFFNTIVLYIVNALLLPLIIIVSGLGVFYSQVLITFFLAIFSYYLQKLFVFKIRSTDK
jgi:putative flippase GtrA